MYAEGVDRKQINVFLNHVVKVMICPVWHCIACIRSFDVFLYHAIKKGFPARSEFIQ